MLSFNAMKVQNFPDIDLPTVSVVGRAAGRGAGAARNRRGAQARELDRHRAGPQAHHTKVQDGAVTHHRRVPAGEAGAGSGGRRALGRGAGAQPTCRRDVRDPIVTKLDLAGQPVLAFTISSSRMDDEALSWFVDNDVTTQAAGACAAWAR